MTTKIRATITGRIVGVSGRKYQTILAQGECDLCGTPFGVQAVIDPGETVPTVGFVHDGPDRHHLTMTGHSEAARALREGHVLASHTSEASDALN